MWDVAHVCETAMAGLSARALECDAEQTPTGIDTLDEVQLHPLMRRGLLEGGYNVLAEQRYPADREKKRRSHGERCDIVLTRSPGEDLIDPLLADTLFAGHGARAEDAFWIEVKVVHQFAVIDGAVKDGVPYTSQLLQQATQDVRKISGAASLPWRAMLIVLFAVDKSVAEHDLIAWAHHCLDQGLNVQSPVVRGFAMTDRIGNAWCSVGLARVRS